MKKILCFGDSNTYGYIPGKGGRYDNKTRWCGVLQTLLAGKFQIIEQGCNNRTGFVDNPAGVMNTGYKILPSMLQDDLSFVILAIGINDLQVFYNITLDDVKNGITNLIQIVREKCTDAQIIIASPSCLTDDVLSSDFSIRFDRTSIEKSKQISEIYKETAEREMCKFIDLEKIVKVSSIDGLHYDTDGHKKIANAMYELICKENIFVLQ